MENQMATRITSAITTQIIMFSESTNGKSLIHEIVLHIPTMQ